MELDDSLDRELVEVWLDNTRIGVTLSVPLSRSQSVKLAYSRGASVRFGQNFETYGAAWQIRWR